MWFAWCYDRSGTFVSVKITKSTQVLVNRTQFLVKITNFFLSNIQNYHLKAVQYLHVYYTSVNSVEFFFLSHFLLLDYQSVELSFAFFFLAL